MVHGFVSSVPPKHGKKQLPTGHYRRKKMSLEERYQCSVCEQCYDDDYDAEQCCPTEIYSFLQCTECKEQYDDYSIKECLSDECIQKRQIVTHKELELAGQQYLFTPHE